MRKKSLLLITILLSTVICLTACSEKEDDYSIKYTVEFDSMGGTDVATQTVKEGEKAVIPTSPTKNLYSFVEWKLENTTYDFDTVVTKDIKLEATWTKTDSLYSITFSTNGGVFESTSAPMYTVDMKGSELLLEPVVSKEGYTLFGWQIKDTTEFFDFTDAYPTKDLSLVAIWEEIPSINVDELDVFISELYESSNTATDRYIEIYNPKNTSVTLTGYTLKFAYNNATLEASSRVIELDYITIAPRSCHVIYYSTATIMDSSVTSNISSNAYILHDADDKYGLYKNNVLIDVVEQIDTVTSAKDSVMVRKYECSASTEFSMDDWTVTRTNIAGTLDNVGMHKFIESYLDAVIYTVKFDTDGGSSVDDKRILKDDYITLPTVSKSGYDLVGWECNGSTFNDDIAITSNITVKAIWEKLSLEDIDLDIFFSEIFDTDEDNNCRFVEIFNPTEDEIDLTGYTVIMSYNNSSFSQTKYVTDLTGLTIQPYTTLVIYDSSMTSAYSSKIQGEKIKSDYILHDGDDNYGLFKDGELIDIIGNMSNTTSFHKDLSLRRNEGTYGSTVFNSNDWTGYHAGDSDSMDDCGKHYFADKPTYIITFDVAGGTYVNPVTVVSGNKLVEQTAPTKEGYKFNGWVYEDELYDFNTLVKQEYTLTATWVEFEGDMFVVTFNTGKGSVVYPQNVYQGDKVVKPATPYYYNHNLIGWTLNGVAFDFDVVITSDITLTAVWEEKIFYTITFETQGSEVETQVIESDQLVQEPLTIRFGYDFDKWRTEDGEEFNFNNYLTSDIVLYASWFEMDFTETEYTVSSVSEYNNTIKQLTPGDTLIFTNGTYDASSMSGISDSINGTPYAPITIKAETTGEVVFTTKTTQEIKGNYITMSGFTFKDGVVNSATGVYVIYGEGTRITNVTIDGFDTETLETSYITIKDSATFTEIDNCNFLNKNSSGVLLLIDKYSDNPMYAHIHHNYFYNYTNPDPDKYTNELETIRIGWSGHSQSACYTVVEYNIFEQISSETELVSVKSGQNVVRNNYVLNCTAAITVRHGNTCLVENNVIIYEDDFAAVNGLRGNGIRIFDKNHVVRNNYIYGVTGTTNSSFNGGIVLHNGGNTIGTENSSLNGQWTTYNVLVQNNTLVNNDVNIALGDKNYNVSADQITFDSNFVYSEATALRDFEAKDYADNNVFINEQYYASGWGHRVTQTSGVSLYINLIPNISVVDGLTYLNDDTNAGAKNLSIVSYDSVGPKDTITEASRMVKADFLAYFNDWPIDLK